MAAPRVLDARASIPDIAACPATHALAAQVLGIQDHARADVSRGSVRGRRPWFGPRAAVGRASGRGARRWWPTGFSRSNVRLDHQQTAAFASRNPQQVAFSSAGTATTSRRLPTSPEAGTNGRRTHEPALPLSMPLKSSTRPTTASAMSSRAVPCAKACARSRTRASPVSMPSCATTMPVA